MFYTSLGRLLMVDLGEDEEKFDAFMMPLTQSFESLGQVLLNQSNGYNSEQVNERMLLRESVVPCRRVMRKVLLCGFLK